MSYQKDKQHGRKEEHVNSEESRQRLRTYNRTALQKLFDYRSKNRNRVRNFQRNLCCKVSFVIPWKQVTCKA
ncbi:hypothetical protein D3C85_1316980 [compost metagenome]